LSPEELEIESQINMDVNFSDVPLEIMEQYSASDVQYTLALFNKFLPLIQKNNLMDIYNKDMDTIARVFRWERRGVSVNVPYLYKGVQVGEERIKELEKEIHKIAGRELNTNSPKQVLETF